jgi:GNAT superfamily N-acetyltransferase
MTIVSLDITNANDAEEVWALQHPAYRVEAALIGIVDLPPLQDTIKSLQVSGETFLGYRNAEGELKGALSFEWERAGYCTLCRLMVHPDNMRQGIGSLLLRQFLSQLPDNSVASVAAEIRNLPALALYKQFGFVQLDTYQPAPHLTMVLLERFPLRSSV